MLMSRLALPPFIRAGARWPHFLCDVVAEHLQNELGLRCFDSQSWHGRESSDASGSCKGRNCSF
jgi:hypothetical protein